TARRLGGRVRRQRRRPPAGRNRSRRGRVVLRASRPLYGRPGVRRPPNHGMNPKARNELIGVAALLLGLFFGLTLLQLPLTGSWGRAIGSTLWQLFGLGAVVLPVLGVGWALAAFERLGPLSWGRAAALGAGLILLVPYGIAIGIGPVFPVDYVLWSATQKLVGLFPAFLASGIQGAVGTAGGVLVGLFALSALGIVTVGWHPLAMLLAPSAERKEEGPRVAVRGAREDRSEENEPAVPRPADRAPRTKPVDRKSKGPPPPKPVPVPAGVLIPPIELLLEPPGPPGNADTAAIEEMGQRLVATLETFRVGAQIIHKTVGPVVT